MNLYFISVKRGSRKEHTAHELTSFIESLSGAEIVDGSGEEVLTVKVSDRALAVARGISYARVEPYHELGILE